MRRVLPIAVAGVIMLSVAAPGWAALKIGDPAPPFAVTDWVKGKPFDIANDGKGKVIVLEFWAVWCAPCIQLIPHTNELYRRYKDKGLLLAAVTDSDQGQQLSEVQRFVAQQGKQMDYPVAFDRTQKTTTAYILGTGSIGIPHAVVVDKRGKIAWFGYPANPEMEQVVRDLLLDRYDPAQMTARAALEARLEPLRRDFDNAALRGDWNECLSITDAMLEIDGANLDALRWTIIIHLESWNRSPDCADGWKRSVAPSPTMPRP